MSTTIAPLHEFLSKLRLYFQDPTNTRKYAHEFELKNGQYIYIKRLKDSFSIFEILRRISLF